MEYYRNELNLISEAKIHQEERYNLKLIESSKKDERILQLEQKIDEIEAFKNKLIQENSSLEAQLIEKVS